MNVLDVVVLTVGVAGILFGCNCYYHLWLWARQCEHARIAIAYKRKVQLQAPLREWLLWSRQIGKGDNGRVVYRNGGVSVAIISAAIPPGPLRRLIRKRRSKQVGQAQSQQGTWSAKADGAKK